MTKPKKPTTKWMNFKFEYIQIPYDNRYFLIFHKHNNRFPIVKISSSDYEEIFKNIVGGLGINLESKKWINFMKKVSQYDEYLDLSEH